MTWSHTSVAYFVFGVESNPPPPALKCICNFPFPERCTFRLKIEKPAQVWNFKSPRDSCSLFSHTLNCDFRLVSTIMPTSVNRLGKHNHYTREENESPSSSTLESYFTQIREK